MNTEFMKGVVVPILTVIDGNEKVDEAGMRDQVEYVIKGGVSGILAFGSNGEFYMVEEDEMERGLRIMGSGGRSCAGVLWHRRHQHQKVLPSSTDGSGKRCRCSQRAAAHVPEAHLRRAV